jgi:hypothetical protein
MCKLKTLFVSEMITFSLYRTNKNVYNIETLDSKDMKLLKGLHCSCLTGINVPFDVNLDQ